jgi:hypothetical protein
LISTFFKAKQHYKTLLLIFGKSSSYDSSHLSFTANIIQGDFLQGFDPVLSDAFDQHGLGEGEVPQKEVKKLSRGACQGGHHQGQAACERDHLKDKVFRLDLSEEVLTGLVLWEGSGQE